MGRIVAVVNQKGGVGKTTTTVNLAAALAIAERPVLVVDADPQANSTRALGIAEDPERPSLYDCLVDGLPYEEVKLGCEGLPHLTILPSDRNLVGAEVELVDLEEREYRLKKLLDPGTPFLELSPLAAYDMYENKAPSAGVVTGIGRVSGSGWFRVLRFLSLPGPGSRGSRGCPGWPWSGPHSGPVPSASGPWTSWGAWAFWCWEPLPSCSSWREG